MTVATEVQILSLRRASWLAIPLLLAIPALAMQVSNEVRWSPGDFVAAAALLVGLRFAIEGAVQMTRTPVARVGALVACVGAFALIWAELAVGLF